MSLNRTEDSIKPSQDTTECEEAINIFPALEKYKNEHNTENLQKLCVEVAEFCRKIYSSTRNDAERQIYYTMLDKLKK